MKNLNLFCFVIFLSIVLASCGKDNCQTEVTWYEDQDGDGLGSPYATLLACNQPDGYVSNMTDNFDFLVTYEQRAVIVYFGAAWCPPCGALGGPLLDFIDENIDPNDALVLAFQRADIISPLESAAYDYGTQIKDVTGVNSVPHLFVGGGSFFDKRGLYTISSANDENITTDVADINKQQSKIFVDGKAQFENDKINVNVGLKFLNDSNEDYYISTFILEDGVIADQKVGTSTSPTELIPNVAHNHVVRENFDGATSYLGKLVGSSFSAGQELTENFTISIPTIKGTELQVNTDNIKVAVVAWRGSSFKMENGVLLNLK